MFSTVPLTVFVLIGIVLEGLIIKQHVLADTLARSRNAARSSASFAKRCRGSGEHR